MNYRQVKAINNSLMGVYEDDYAAFVAYWVNDQALPRKDEEYLTLGSVVDTLLTKPDDYDELFAIFKGKAPTAPQMVKFCSELSKLYSTGMPVEGYYSLAYEAAGISTPKLEGFVARFLEYKPYFEFLVSSTGKSVITKEQASKAGVIVEQLRNNPYTKAIVNAEDTPNGQVFNQLEIYGQYEGIPTKGAIDRLLVSHTKRTVQPVDFKSSYNVLDFRTSYFKYRYYRQGSYYSHLLENWLKEKGWGDYKILPFTFVVCSTSGGQHWLYRMSKEDLFAAQLGGETKFGYKIKGWQTILDEIVYLQDKREWAFPYECLAHNGIMELNIFK